MAELNFIETSAKETLDDVLEELENGVNEPLYPGDERRIFGETLVQVFVAFYNKVNDSCRQKMLRYARGEVLDAIGETRDVYRQTSTPATTTLRFGVSEAVTSNIVIPKGLRVTGDFMHYFLTDATVVLPAGSLFVEVTATAEDGGEEYNDIAPGGICEIVDVSDVPLIDYVSNIDATEGGGDVEGDEQYRERIREAENRLSTAGPAKAYKYWALSANPLVSDAIVENVTERTRRKLKTYSTRESTISTEHYTLPIFDTPNQAGGRIAQAFIGGSVLPDTLVVYLPDGSVAVKGTDYSYSYHEDLQLFQINIIKGGGFAGDTTLSEMEGLVVDINREATGYNMHAFQGGSGLLPDTLVVYLPDGSEAVAGEDYTATYEDGLLWLELSGELADAAEVETEITSIKFGHVKIVPICAGGEIPSEDVLADVLAACSADDVKPLTDVVVVEAPGVAYYDIELTYWTTKADESEVVQNVEGPGGAIDNYVYWQGSTLNQDINPDELWKRIVCPHWEEGLTGATRAVITKPEYTELPGTTVAKFSGNIKVSHIVKD
jgi:phage-related baseplate assembly protein